MAQPSVACYFNTRKRNATEDLKITRARKVLHQEVSDSNEAQDNHDFIADKAPIKVKTLPIDPTSLSAKIVQLANLQNEGKIKAKKPVRSSRAKKVIDDQQNIQELLNNMIHKDKDEPQQTKLTENEDNREIQLHKTPPATPTKTNAMDKVKVSIQDMSMKEVRQKLTRSSRLAELKASMARFKEKDAKLKEIEKHAPKTSESPGLKSFKSIELEVNMSPVKSQTPEKMYLSPRKDSTAKRNLLNLLSPSKNAINLPKTSNKLLTTEKLALTLPFKYRTLAELFRSIDTVSQIMHNRKEMITFKKLKPAVEELIKRNLNEKHLAQIKFLLPDAFTFRQDKLRAYGSKVESWELVIEPHIEQGSMSSDALLERRRKLFNVLIEKVKIYHQEFLSSLEPPIVVDAEKIKRWHPEFDIERVPDIECAELPKAPVEEKFTTGKDVLDRAKLMFNCNTRMEAALERLQKARDNSSHDQVVPEPAKVQSETLLKGIPKSLLEKVRQKQAAKALESMTRTDAKDKEVQVYSHLPELARLTRNLFVAEKRSVLQLDIVLEKLGNSIRTFLKKEDIEARLKLIEKEVPGWLMFHNIRNQIYIKIAKDADLSIVQHKLEKILKLKQSA